ncbi:MAG: class I SAM-dependent methyltransferase, partial [archaeon]
RGLKFYLVDFSEEMIKLAKKKARKLGVEAEFFVAESTKLPFEDNYFDSGLCDSVLHCIEKSKDRRDTLKELYRVLKPGARAKISVWNKDSKRFKNSPKEKYVGWRDKGKRFYYLYEPEEFYKEVEKAGFKIIKKAESRSAIPIIVEKPDY